MTIQIAEELGAIAQVTEPALRALDSGMVSIRPAPDRWAIKEVVGHLIDSAANNHQRFVRAQLVQNLVFPKYEQNEWVRSQHYNDADWQVLINLWAGYNRHLAHIIRNVSKEALEIQCVIGDNEPVSLQFLMEDYVVHLKHHLREISERLNLDPQHFAC